MFEDAHRIGRKGRILGNWAGADGANPEKLRHIKAC